MNLAAAGVGCLPLWWRPRGRTRLAAISAAAAFLATTSHNQIIVLAPGTQPPYPYTRNWPAYPLGHHIVAYIQPASH